MYDARGIRPKSGGETGTQDPIGGVCGVQRLLLQEPGDEVRVRLIRVLLEQAREFVLADASDQLRCGFASLRVHPHVEWTHAFVTEAAIRIVELHRRHAEVGEN